MKNRSTNSITEIIAAVADRYELEPKSVCGRDRDRDTYVARSHAIMLCFQHGFTPQKISKAFKRDLTSVHAAMGAFMSHERQGWTYDLDIKGAAQ